ncbi:MAG: DHA2 family efflux MFS transporter permease subunit [Microthrixaceae bacterium]
MTPELIHRRRWGILAVLSLSVFLVVVDNTIVNVALPTLSRELDASTSQLQWIVDAYSLVFAGLLLAFGSLGDRFGRKGVMQLGLVLFGITSVVAAFAGSAQGLIAARAAMGIGAAFVFPATLAILTNVFTDPTERAKAIGVWSATSGLAVALGPLAGGWMLEHFWWGSIFLVNVPIVLVALALGVIMVPTSKDPDAGRLDPVGLVTSIAAIGLLVFTVIEAPHRGWTSAATLGGFALFAVVLVLFIGWEQRRRDPMLDVSVFRNPRFSAASAAVAVAFFGLFGFIFLITQYFQVVRGYSTLSAGVHTLPFAITAAIAAPIAARLALRFGTKRVVTAALVSMTVGFLWASTFDADTPYWGPVVGSMVLMALGLTMTTAPATDAILGSLPKEKAGVGSAVNDTTRELGGTLGVAVVGSVFSSIYGPKLIDALSGLPIPPDALDAAAGSVQAAAMVAEQAPPEGRTVILDAARTAFLDGMSSGVRVAAVATALGAVAALLFLPARPVTPVEELADGDAGADEDTSTGDVPSAPVVGS